MRKISSILTILYCISLAAKGIASQIRLFNQVVEETDGYFEYNSKSHENRNEASSRTLKAAHDGSVHLLDSRTAAHEIVVALPDVGSISFRKTSYQLIGPNSSTYRTWNGMLIGGFGKASFVMLPNDELVCNISVGTSRFWCLPCGGDALPSCVKVVKMPSKPHGTKSLSTKKIPNRVLFEDQRSRASYEDEESRRLLDDGTMIDVLILYTAAAVKEFQSELVFRAFLASAIAQNNDIYVNNGIELESKVVAWIQVDYVETGDLESSMTYLQSDVNIAMNRDKFAADLVSLVTMDQEYGAGYGSYANFPNPVTSSRDQYAFSIVGATNAVNDYLFSISWGLNFGCDVDFANSKKDRILPYAYGYQSKTCDFHTIMATPCEGSEAISYYSTPDLTYTKTNEPLGNADTADCSRVFKEYKLLVSQYRDSVTNVVTLAPSDSPTPAPTMEVEPTPAPTPKEEPTPAPTPKEEPTPAPTPKEEPTPIPSSSPSPTKPVSPYFEEDLPFDGQYYTSRYTSRLIGQSAWSDQMDSEFVLRIQSFVRSVENAADAVVVTDGIRYMTSNTRKRNRSLQTINAVDVSFSISKIFGMSTTAEVSSAVKQASDNGNLVQALKLLPDLFTMTGIETISIGDPELEPRDDGNEFSILIISIVVVVAFTVCSCCIVGLRKRNDIKNRIDSYRRVNKNQPIPTSVAHEQYPASYYPVSHHTEPAHAEQGVTELHSALPAQAPIHDTPTLPTKPDPILNKDLNWIETLMTCLPAAGYMYGVCSELEESLSGESRNNGNLKKVSEWIGHVKTVLMELGEHLCQFPESEKRVNNDQLEECKAIFESVRHSVRTFKRNELFSEFICSRKMQSYITDTSNSLHNSTERLNLKSNRKAYKTELQIEDSISTLISAIDDLKVSLVLLATALKSASRHHDNPACVSVLSKLSSTASYGGAGPILNEFLLAKAHLALEGLQMNDMKIEKVSLKPTTVKGSSRMYLVKCDGFYRMAKDVVISTIPFEKIQDLYLKLAWEVYVLSTLKHAHVVSMIGFTTSILEYRIIYENFQCGNLRSMLDNPNWQFLTAEQRHKILSDIAEGMAYLHEKMMHHKNLSSHAIMLTNDYRAKIGEFGLSLTSSCIAEQSQQTTNELSAWMAPELFGPRRIGQARLGDKCDVYSYGIIIFEVLASLAGEAYSTPWQGLLDPEIIAIKTEGKELELPHGWDDEENVVGSSVHRDIMLSCLEPQPSPRPTFNEIVMQHGRISEGLV